MDWKDVLRDVEFSFTRISSLIVILIGSCLAMMEIVLPFLQGYIASPIVLWSIFIIIEFGIVAVWYYKRSIYPKGSKKHENLILAISTENSKQKTRITNDLANELRKQLSYYKLDESYQIIVLSNHLSKAMAEKIKLWYKARKAGISTSVEVNSFQRITKRLNARFYVYGDLILRNAEKGSYFMEVDALILHSPTTLATGQTFHSEFNKLWKREISFLEEDELTGFRDNAKHIFFTAAYMLGLATFVNNNFAEGAEIWSRLEKYVRKNADLKDYLPKILQLKGVSYFLLSRYYQFRGDMEAFVKYRKMYLDIIPNEYDRHLLQAINQLRFRNDPELALDHVERASELARSDGTWRYSKFYLLIKMGRLEKALKFLDDILGTTYKDERDSVHQVINYNMICLQEDKSHIQTHFIVGVFLFLKLDQPLQGYSELEKFVEKTKDLKEWEDLHQRALHYLNELDRMMNIGEEE